MILSVIIAALASVTSQPKQNKHNSQPGSCYTHAHPPAHPRHRQLSSTALGTLHFTLRNRCVSGWVRLGRVLGQAFGQGFGLGFGLGSALVRIVGWVMFSVEFLDWVLD